MSRTTTLTYGTKGFWALDDAFGVWIAYLVEEIDRHACDPWLETIAEDWRVAAAETDFGAHIPPASQAQVASLRALAVEARARAVEAGDVSVEDLRTWFTARDLPVAHGFSRTGDRVELPRILEVADGFLSLIDNALPPDPPGGAWLLGTGKGFLVIAYREKFPGDVPRFPNRDP